MAAVEFSCLPTPSFNVARPATRSLHSDKDGSRPSPLDLFRYWCSLSVPGKARDASQDRDNRILWTSKDILLHKCWITMERVNPYCDENKKLVERFTICECGEGRGGKETRACK